MNANSFVLRRLALVLLLAGTLTACGGGGGGDGDSDGDGDNNGGGGGDNNVPPGFARLNETILEPENFIVNGNRAFFTSLGDDSYDERDLIWVTDGTADGTHLVTELGAGDAAGHARLLTAFKDGVVLTGWDGTHSGGLWFTDGTEDGTYLIKDVTTTTSENIFFVGVGGDYFYFTAEDGVHGRELWASDGTSDGTYMIVDLNPDGSSNIERHTAATYWDGYYYVFAWYYEAGTFTAYPQLYRTNGSQGNFEQLTNNTVPGSVLLDYDMIVFNDQLFFTWKSWENEEELWVTDGTPAGTRQVVNIAPEHSGYTYGSWPTNFHVLGDSMLFFAYEDGTGAHKSLYRTDGTESGTELVHSVDLGVLTEDMVRMGDRYYFAGRTHDENYYTLWSTDGTSSGTAQISASVYPEYSEFDQRAVVLGDRLVFTGADGVNGNEPWVTDGTGAGTFMLENIHAETSSFTANGGKYVVRGDKAYFIAAPENENFQLYETDGTAAGTRSIAPDDATVTVNPLGQEGFASTVEVEMPVFVNGVLLFKANFHGTSTLYKY